MCSALLRLVCCLCAHLLYKMAREFACFHIRVQSMPAAARPTLTILHSVIMVDSAFSVLIEVQAGLKM